MNCSCEITPPEFCPEHQFDGPVVQPTSTVAYVCGFLFSPDYKHVVLIEKQRPDWQRGKLNGVGGKIEHGETPQQAMRREFLEECGVDVVGWKQFVSLRGKGWVVYFFHAIGDVETVGAMTDEAPIDVWVERLPMLTMLVPNLKWLIPLALTGNTQGELYEQNEEASAAAKDRGSSAEHAIGSGTDNTGR